MNIIRAIGSTLLSAACFAIVYFWWKWAMVTTFDGLTLGGAMMFIGGGMIMMICFVLTFTIALVAIGCWYDVYRDVRR